MFLKLSPNRSKFISMILSAPVAIMLLCQAPVASAGQEKVSNDTPCVNVKGPRACDPFDGMVWHAIEGSWPGTIKFDGKKKKVELQPLGGNPIQAAYVYTTKVESSGNRKVLNGTLTMTSEKGEVSKATYRMQGRHMVLSYPGLANTRDENYLRMTPDEEAAEILRIKKLLSEGRPAR